MTVTTPAGAAAGAPELLTVLANPAVDQLAAVHSLPTRRRRRRRRKNTTAMRRRREAAARTHRAVVASLTLGHPPAVQAPPAGQFVRRDVLEPAEVQALLRACSSSSRLGVRDRALLAVGYWACVRLEEAVTLHLDDVEVQAGILTVHGRNGVRAVQLPTEALELIGAWVDRRRRLHKPRMHVGLFCTLQEGQRPGPVTRHTLTEALERVARAAKITKPVTFDALRAARARELALAGAELAPLSSLLDHMHLKTPRQDGRGRGELRQDLDRTRRLLTELAPQAPCIGFFRPRYRVPVTFSEYRLGKEAPNKGMKLPPEPLTSEELRAMLRAVCKSPGGARNAALLVVLWRAGLRIAEALDLEHRDIDLKHRMLTVRQGKGAKRRVVGIDPRAMVYVERWLEVREKELGLARQGKVFCSVQLPMRGQPMSTSSARDMLKNLARAAGVEKRVHPHGFRHTHAFELMQEGVPLPIIQKQLGHNDLATTARYIDHLNPRQVVEAMQARQWAFTR